MALKTKGSPTHYIERITLDRVGFISATVAMTYVSDEFIEMPEPPVETVQGAIWTRTDVSGEPGLVTVRWLYEGIGEGQTDPVVQYGWDASYETVPIQAHSDYRSWLGVYGVEDSNGNFRPYRTIPKRIAGSFDYYLSGGGETPNPLLGVEAFLSSGGVWTRRSAYRELPDGLMARVGMISETVPGPVPPIPPGRNWLKGPPSMTWRGNAWDILEQWILSGRGGHNPVVYDGSTE